MVTKRTPRSSAAANTTAAAAKTAPTDGRRDAMSSPAFGTHRRVWPD